MDEQERASGFSTVVGQMGLALSSHPLRPDFLFIITGFVKPGPERVETFAAHCISGVPEVVAVAVAQTARLLPPHAQECFFRTAEAVCEGRPQAVVVTEARRSELLAVAADLELMASVCAEAPLKPETARRVAGTIRAVLQPESVLASAAVKAPEG